MSNKHDHSWPAIPVRDWQDTRDTLHLYTQVIGKVRLANEPLVNHWWNTTLYLTAVTIRRPCTASGWRWSA
jgi:hypothetical protein